VNIEARKSDRPEDFSVPVSPLFAEEFPIELHLENASVAAACKKLAWMTWSELRSEEARLAAWPQSRELIPWRPGRAR
jgi:hypothetical protein